MIEMGKEYQTRNGRAVRILATDMKGIFCVAGIIIEANGSEHIYSWKEDGAASENNDAKLNRYSDLVPVLTKHGGWAAVSVSRHWIGTAYENYVDALADALQQTREHDPPAYSVTRVYALDSVPIPVPTKHEGWMAFDTGDYCLYTSREQAERAIQQDVLATSSYVAAHVTWGD